MGPTGTGMSRAGKMDNHIPAKDVFIYRSAGIPNGQRGSSLGPAGRHTAMGARVPG